MDAIYRVGRPIRYSYVAEPWNLDYYQTVYAREPGSTEMPSAGRAFTWRLLFDLKRRGIEIAYVMLHTGLSSYMDDELDARHPASEEEYIVGQPAAEMINLRHRDGGRSSPWGLPWSGRLNPWQTMRASFTPDTATRDSMSRRITGYGSWTGCYGPPRTYCQPSGSVDGISACRTGANGLRTGRAARLSVARVRGPQPHSLTALAMRAATTRSSESSNTPPVRPAR